MVVSLGPHRLGAADREAPRTGTGAVHSAIWSALADRLNQAAHFTRLASTSVNQSFLKAEPIGTPRSRTLWRDELGWSVTSTL